MKYYIYALVDPRNQAVRYVGKSRHPSKRLEQHLSFQIANSYKQAWLSSLRRLGLYPVLAILEETTLEESNERERYWIASYSDLTNMTPGGDGGNGGASGWKHSKDSKLAIANSLKGIIRSDETRDLQSARRKGRIRSQDAVINAKHGRAVALEQKSIQLAALPPRRRRRWEILFN